jgi:hypothetical protein
MEYGKRAVPDQSSGRTKTRQKWIGEKIAHLIREEGKTPKQAAGQAYGMARQKR